MPNKFAHLDQIHNFFATAHVGAFAAGLAIGQDKINFENSAFLFICILIRIKFWVDDLEYFRRVAAGKYPNNTGFYIGLVLAIASWVTWLIAGLNVKDLELSAQFMFITFLISTAWVFATYLDKGLYYEQVGWAFYNPIYAAGFFLLWKRKATWLPFEQYVDLATYSILAILLILFLIDLSNSRTLSALARTDPD